MWLAACFFSPHPLSLVSPNVLFSPQIASQKYGKTDFSSMTIAMQWEVDNENTSKLIQSPVYYRNSNFIGLSLSGRSKSFPYRFTLSLFEFTWIRWYSCAQPLFALFFTVKPWYYFLYLVRHPIVQIEMMMLLVIFGPARRQEKKIVKRSNEKKEEKNRENQIQKNKSWIHPSICQV